MGLKDQLAADLKVAMKEQDALRRETLRLLRAAVRNAEIAAGKVFEADEELIPVIVKQAKQREESVAEYRRGGREDLAAKEEQELAILQGYLPEALTEDELQAMVAEAIEACGAQGPSDLGKVMRELMPKVRGRADGKAVNELVRAALSEEG